MLKYPLYTVKNNAAKKKLICEKLISGLQKDTSKIDDIVFDGAAHTLQDFRK